MQVYLFSKNGANSMIALQRTLQYLGNNRDEIVTNFVQLAQLNINFKWPCFNYGVFDIESPVKRKILSYEKAALQQTLADNDYRQIIPLKALVGDISTNDGTSPYYANFIQYYFASINSENPENLAFSISYQVNQNAKKAFSASILLSIDESAFRFLYESQSNSRSIEEFLANRLVLVNFEVAQEVYRRLDGVLWQKLWLFMMAAVRSGSELPELDIPSFSDIDSLLTRYNLSPLLESDYEQIKRVVEEYSNSLFDFSVQVAEIKPLQVAGVLLFVGEKKATYQDLQSYQLILEYSGKYAQGKSEVYSWPTTSSQEIENQRVDFDFSNEGIAVDAVQADDVTISLKLYDGSIFWQHTYSASDSRLQQLQITVRFNSQLVTVVDTPATEGQRLSLKGQVVDGSNQCPVKDLTVIVQTKTTSESLWKVVGVATTDITGSFMMAYPQGVFVKAQALVSLAPNEPADIVIYEDNAHVAAQQTIATDFIYLVIDGYECQDKIKNNDCDCTSTTKIPRLPDQSELINSDKFSQDLGGGMCVNLTTPNRTLSEHSYYALVRTSDPDVANYVLEKNTTIEQADGFQRVTFSLGDGQKVKRGSVSLDNPIRWQDAPDNRDKLSIYQAVSVATGHLLHYKTVLKADGYSLGDLLYSLPLAPGQKKQIVVYDWKRSLQASESQQLVQREGLTASVVNDRSIIDSLTGNINEAIRGQSSASTGGVSAGLGVGAIIGPVGAVLGVSGGYSTSSSNASQNSSRTTSQAFGETLRNSIMQSANAYRELNATLIDTVTEGQQFSTTTEVVANHNHCHSLTILYFEVLRHYAVYQELAAVEECIFVPLIMTEFTQENIRRYRDVLAANLLNRPSSTYWRFAIERNPLVKAFDANERVITSWANVDFPTGRYCDEPILNIKGEINLRVYMPRPKTRYDRVKSLPIISQTVAREEFDVATAAKSAAIAVATGGLSLLFGGGSTTKTVTEQVLVRSQIFDAFMQLDANFQTVQPAYCIRVTDFQPKSFTIGGITIPISGLDFFENGTNDKQQWEAYANVLGYTNPDGVYKMLDYYFKGRLISEWDDIFNNDILPVLFERMVASINIENIAVDLTTMTPYRGGERIIQVKLQGSTNLTRAQLPLNIKISSASTVLQPLKDFVTFNADYVNLIYTTAHFNGVLFSGRVQDNLLRKGTDLFIPLNNNDKRDPRKEDKFLVNELLTHLNANLEHYNKILWYSLDSDRRYLLLDGFQIQVYDDFNQPAAFKSLASIVKNQLIGIAGNSLVFPVAAGVKVDRSYIIARDPENQQDVKLSLFDHYKPITPAPPFRISVPTRGIYAEAVQGACDACETVKDNSSQDWDKFKTDEPTSIQSVPVPTPTVTDWKAAFKDFATPIVNIQNAPTAPAPGAGLAGLSDLLGKSDIFKDVTGLDGNQKNAIATYLSNQENARAFAEMAKGMAMQAHNTQNSEKIKRAINDAQTKGSLGDTEAKQLTKDHIQQMIDGGESKKAEAEKEQAAKSSLTDAAVKAAEQGKTVKAESIDTKTGKNERVEINGASSSDKVLASITGTISKLKQANSKACWATVATIMMRWKLNDETSLSVAGALAIAGKKYVDKFNAGEGLKSSEKEEFVSALGMVSESPASYPLQKYIDWVNTFGPLWITTDSSASDGVFSPHARILYKIVGAGTPDGLGTDFIFIDPLTGTEVRESYSKFLKAYEEMVTDNKGDLFIQIVHFTDEIGSEGGGDSGTTSVSPFSTKLYPTEMAPSPAQNTRLAAAIQTVRGTLSDANKTRLDNMALIVVKLTPSGTMEYAGVRETEMFFSASLLKVALLYTSFELVSRVNEMAPLITACSAAEFFVKVRKEFSGKIENAVPQIKPGVWRKVNFKEALTATSDASGVFRVSLSTGHDQDLRSIFSNQNQNLGALNCMHRLGFSYVNGALDAAGFFGITSQTGIWMATDYIPDNPPSADNWPSFNIPVATNGTSSAAMTALSMANLLNKIDRGELINATTSQTMRDIFRTGNAWLSKLSNPNAFSFTATGAKVGHSSSPSARVGSVMSEAAFLERKSDSAPFVAVWQNVPDELGSEPIYKVIDEMINNWL
jgi:hypothetical protein